jgi:hypothetical protein
MAERALELPAARGNVCHAHEERRTPVPVGSCRATLELLVKSGMIAAPSERVEERIFGGDVVRRFRQEDAQGGNGCGIVARFLALNASDRLQVLPSAFDVTRAFEPGAVDGDPVLDTPLFHDEPLDAFFER